MKLISVIFSVIILSSCVSIEKYNKLNDKLDSFEHIPDYQEKYESLKTNYDDREKQIEYYLELLNNYFLRNNDISQNLNYEQWGKDWKVIQNSMNEYYPTGWYRNKTSLKEVLSIEDLPESEGFIFLHPIDRSTPAILEFNGIIDIDRTRLNMILTGSVHGDSLFQVEINNEIVETIVINGEKWEEIGIDLTEYIDKEVNIKLFNFAGGRELWQFEHCFITDINFTNNL